MNVARPCVACQSTNTCECRSSLARFFELLIEADKRVSSMKVTSNDRLDLPVTASACVDKIEGRLSSPIPISNLIRSAHSMGLKSRRMVLRSRKHCLQVGDQGTYLRISFDNETVTHLISKPSAFANRQLYCAHLASLLGQETLANLVVTRVDLTVDYDMPFKRAVSAIDVSGKQADTEYEDRSSAFTGLRIGKGHDKVVIYDKQREAKLNGPKTRIELQLSGSKLPARQVDQVFEVLGSLNPFKHVEVFDLIFKDELVLDPARASRLHQLKTLIEEFGFIRTRRRLNAQGNFQRDFASLFTRQQWPNQPSTVFRAAMKSFTT